ncbi:MAG: efflux transporter outer membrane subunit [Gemmatimonadaceae bacterium]|nr:efflux transporter outer membrane subunit [Gemmatimonadaceae bacterium]
MNTRLVFVAVAVLTSSACAVGPSTRVDTAVPAVPVRTATSASPNTRTFLDSLRAARQADRGDSISRITSQLQPESKVIPATATSMSAWSEVLRDTTLSALIREAVANNRNLRVAQQRINEFRALRGVAASRFFPQINGGTSLSTNKIALAAAPPIEFDAARLTSDLAWELDFWGRTRRATQAAGFELSSREDDVRATTLSLVSDVASAYLQLREADAIIAIAEQTLVSREATLQLARRRFEQGLISELDVRQFEATVADPAARVADYARMRIEGENALSVLLGTAPKSMPRGHRLSDIVKTVVVPDTLSGELLARRPDVLRAQHDLQAATARVGVAQAARLPTFSVTGQYGAQRPTFNDIFGGRGEIYTLQAGISVPLFTGGRLSNEAKAAKARAEQSKHTYEQVVLVALREVSDAAAGVRLRRDQLAAQETQERALQAAFTIAERRYASGISSYLEVLDAQRSLFAAQLTRVQTERQFLVATVQLYRALGGGWE